MEAAALLARLAWCLAGLAVAVPRGAATGTLLRSHTRARNARTHTRREVGVCMLCHRHDLLLIVTSSPCIPTSMKTSACRGWTVTSGVQVPPRPSSSTGQRVSCQLHDQQEAERQSGGQGKRMSVRVDIGGTRCKKK